MTTIDSLEGMSWSAIYTTNKKINLYGKNNGKVLLKNSDIADRLMSICVFPFLWDRLMTNPWSIGKYIGDTAWNVFDDSAVYIIQTKLCGDMACSECPVTAIGSLSPSRCSMKLHEKPFKVYIAIIYLILKWGVDRTKELLVEALV